MAEKRRPGQMISLKGSDSIFGLDGEESKVEIPVQDIIEFKNHPFKVIENESMQDLIESIQENGVLSPVLVREIPNDNSKRPQYEMISGHRRLYAARKCRLSTIPAFVRELTDDEAIIAMVDSNIQREQILPSERAFALKMKMDAIRHQGKILEKNTKHSVDQIGESSGLSGRQVQRYIRLTSLIPQLLNRVDEQYLPMVQAVEISYLPIPVQSAIDEYLIHNKKISSDLIDNLHRRDDLESLSKDMVKIILAGKNRNDKISRKITISDRKLNSYFSDAYSKEDIEKIVFALLEQWKSNK